MAKKTPMRLCLGCNAMKPKRELIRAVKPPEGDVFIDVTGKKPGRGAYVCPDTVCFKKARRSKRLERAFGRAIPEEVYANCEGVIERLNEK